MKKIFSTLLLSLISLWCIGQERIMISSGYIVIDKGTTGTPSFLVIDNPNSNAIQRTAGGIITDATTTEFNQVQWDIGTSTGVYTVPFQYSTTNYIPVVFNNTGGAGTGAH